jgi:hypothetical protein
MLAGRRNQSFFYFNPFPKPRNHPNLWFSLFKRYREFVAYSELLADASIRRADNFPFCP